MPKPNFHLKSPRTHLSQDLKSLVHRSVAILGEVIEAELGETAYHRIERMRKNMTELRGASAERSHRILEASLAELKKLPSRSRLDFAHAFTLMLETMNACENAYRSYRVRGDGKTRFESSMDAMVFVLTAHPTEARSPVMISAFHSIRSILEKMLRDGFEAHEIELRHWLKIAWKLRTARRRKPKVRDEAEHLYSIVLREEVVDLLIESSKDLAPVYLRTWVGGDKDGHPFVNAQASLASLSLARLSLLAYVKNRIVEVRKSIDLLGEKSLIPALARLKKDLASLRVLKTGDAGKIVLFRKHLRQFCREYESVVGATHPSFRRIQKVIELFPALVMPLELRESSEIVHLAAQGKKTAIGGMLELLERLARGGDVRWYARGFILSMASSLEDLQAGARVVRNILGRLQLPVIPLFEQREALLKGPDIVKQYLANTQVRESARRYWNGHVEVMLGYSDSAKESGVVMSRVEIATAMRGLDAVIRRKGLQPVFFHGSGGSVDRGGGSIQEQTEWWPSSALKLYKATIQGEMIDRTFGSPDIARRQMESIVRQSRQKTSKGRASPASVRDFAERVSHRYTALVNDAFLGELISQATPYRYLSALRIGSRPSKRTRDPSLKSLRAIPWVLCWTQTRVLFPTWWGVGAAWSESTPKQRRELKRAFARDPLFRSFMKVLGFTLAKVELPIWNLYLGRAGWPHTRQEFIFDKFEKEFRQAVECVRALTGEKDLLWFRPWLGESVRLRSPMIHPLNLLQMLSMDSHDNDLMRECVTGIAVGMMTTG